MRVFWCGPRTNWGSRRPAPACNCIDLWVSKLLFDVFDRTSSSGAKGYLHWRNFRLDCFDSFE